jgi:hypothetical protein
MKISSRRGPPGVLPVAWCPFPLFRPLGLVISYVVINTGLLFISLFVSLCVKLDPDTHKGNAFSFSLKTGCDSRGSRGASCNWAGVVAARWVPWVERTRGDW